MLRPHRSRSLLYPTEKQAIKMGQTTALRMCFAAQLGWGRIVPYNVQESAAERVKPLARVMRSDGRQETHCADHAACCEVVARRQPSSDQDRNQ